MEESVTPEADVKVLIDEDRKKVLLRFEGDPDDEDGPSGVEITLAPELARDIAFTLTRASYIVEGDDKL